MEQKHIQDVIGEKQKIIVEKEFVVQINILMVQLFKQNVIKEYYIVQLKDIHIVDG